jgi:hypothetical protein
MFVYKKKKAFSVQACHTFDCEIDNLGLCSVNVGNLVSIGHIAIALTHV